MKQFTMENYGRKSTFASFLPGIAGIKGIPIWCYYVNRGQAVVSFGVENKDHSIMEFCPAHTSYQNAKRTGFRTFMRLDGKFRESFYDETVDHSMSIEMNCLSVKEDAGVKTEVTYFVLPEETIGALVRKLVITNDTDAEMSLEFVDGMPALIPYGVSLDSMKNMAQLSKAWMQVENLETKVPCFRVRASMADTASVSTVDGSNFALAVDKEGKLCDVIVDNDVLFAYDNSLDKPVELLTSGVDEILAKKQNVSNLVPGCFFAGKKTLAKGESITLYELYGQVENQDILKEFLASHKLDANYFEDKLSRARELTDEITECIDSHTGNEAFDAYTRYTYMDNVLRGGLPIKLGDNKTFYVYSRKHGDLEREYNFFSMSPEFFSQGNGNFRDVNQNRRCDVFFHPDTGKDSIHLFYDLIQLDGYNPLAIEKKVYNYNGETFTPGALYKKLLKEGGDEGAVAKKFSHIMSEATEALGANFGEGYWTDHWTYNLDLIEEYLGIYPEKEKELLLENRYTYFLSQEKVNPRAMRYVVTENGVRQYNALDESTKRDTPEKLVRTGDGKGTVYTGTLLEKLILLCTTKYATLDPYCMGTEMEGGKPGWYDALNGLPGIFGSSMAETYELDRMLEYTIHSMDVCGDSLTIFRELADFIRELNSITDKYQDEMNADQSLAHVEFWNAINDAKEEYRDKIYNGISGETTAVSLNEIKEILVKFKAVVAAGIKKAFMIGNGLAPTYFYYEVTDVKEDANGVHPLGFLLHVMPAFLEGPVRFLKLPVADDQKKALYNKVKSSNLYDEKLSMYKVNEPLAEASYEIGRCKCFTPGWLENESIWLHMEYKYLLEVIKSGMYKEFIEDFHTACVPFMDPEVYGRSILENSSFIASSANPNESIHGKGFVARLSGSTIEFISIWKIMMFGKTPFKVQDGSLCFKLCPVIPEYLIGSDKKVTAKLLGQTVVEYNLEGSGDFIPGNYTVSDMELVDRDGNARKFIGDTVSNGDAAAIRDGEFATIKVTLKK
ncbi:MAG: hypothetical protein K5773_08910 [Pseudobutyrivibrio sp.]|nr:hypothetical protein [Pseudobutyrivibrio sp.]